MSLSGSLGPARCDKCGQPLVMTCEHCSFPVFGMLGGMRMLARGLVAHYGYNPDDHPGLVAELENTIGGELLDIGREALAGHGMAALGPLG